jgi:hypothetical protein
MRKRGEVGHGQVVAGRQVEIDGLESKTKPAILVQIAG